MPVGQSICSIHEPSETRIRTLIDGMHRARPEFGGRGSLFPLVGHEVNMTRFRKQENPISIGFTSWGKRAKRAFQLEIGVRW